MTKPHAPGDGSVIVVVGGAGFVGSNLANAYATDGARVRIVDSLARPGSEKNLAWLKSRHRDNIEAAILDIRDDTALTPALEGAGAIFHMAAQVAVTTSIDDPRTDFDVNARGTLNMLEWLRTTSPHTPLVFASTNKVYGCLEDVPTTLRNGRHEPLDETLAARGVNEGQPLVLRTPYGCSKGAADQYVLDYSRSYGLRTAVLRMSCIYGPRQFGNEDQGWVAHFLLRALEGGPITIYGDGAKVR
ncbi:MAG: NAD-dependent epimerase/dehydratase family protein, partial [Beijerinckiaceae bacterium]|nr:NAD-dependent epimerase/dehydratase family protein [Beijerinckiaceae bacterium]